MNRLVERRHVGQGQYVRVVRYYVSVFSRFPFVGWGSTGGGWPTVTGHRTTYCCIIDINPLWYIMYVYLWTVSCVMLVVVCWYLAWLYPARHTPRRPEGPKRLAETSSCYMRPYEPSPKRDPLQGATSWAQFLIFTYIFPSLSPPFHHLHLFPIAIKTQTMSLGPLSCSFT
jgi:hypothetical protein